MTDTGIVNIHGKEYRTVGRRIADFREKHPDYRIITKVKSAAELVMVKATIMDNAGNVLATGYAEEVRGSTNINKTSAVENAETSAVGRALAFFGLGGTEIASADEVATAIKQQEELEQVEVLKAHNAAVREHLDSIMAIKSHLLNEDWWDAYEALSEIPEDDRRALWLATTKGGIWTTKEREQIKSDEMAQARKDYHGGEVA